MQSFALLETPFGHWSISPVFQVSQYVGGVDDFHSTPVGWKSMVPCFVVASAATGGVDL